ncbi:Crp/Fnr family transcriptional regulator [Pedobacter fastidiosus]|uniref:Crp/Fnr family transcriptional regulator n=1 Tax=Pedobacter fastidiosus TaxID=2765361 RepID=A0ABR7KYK7_9SPHI|nr:Crp/Fnr family transcriptional regulator [Pedobacter fastidiosus]MBC6112895.1 Crp/Fnr family transcriptional regulator [Pedobacter fastidiosus]
MFETLKKYCQSIVSLSNEELDLIPLYFEKKDLKKREYLLHDNEICNFIAFVSQGSIRHFHVKDGVEKTCDISFENAWVTDFQSFTHNSPCIMNLQAMEETIVFLIRKNNLKALYQVCGKYETFGRIMAEQVAQRATEIAMSLSSEKPEERFQKLIKNQPNLFQRISQKYIANFLGISPESLSRIQNRIITKRKS